VQLLNLAWRSLSSSHPRRQRLSPPRKSESAVSFAAMNAASVEDGNNNKKAVLSQGNRAMPQMFFFADDIH